MGDPPSLLAVRGSPWTRDEYLRLITDGGYPEPLTIPLPAHLLGAATASLRTPGHPALGGLVETFVLAELVKLQSSAQDDFRIYHLRDKDGAEVDFILEAADGTIAALEVKATATPRNEDAKHLRWLKGKLGDRLRAAAVITWATPPT